MGFGKAVGELDARSGGGGERQGDALALNIHIVHYNNDLITRVIEFRGMTAVGQVADVNEAINITCDFNEDAEVRDASNFSVDAGPRNKL